MEGVLILGAGHVTAPLVRYLIEKAQIKVTVATRTVEKGDAIINGHPIGKTVRLDVNNSEQLESLIRRHRTVVSMVPPKFHNKIAQICVDLRKDFVSTSYITQEIEDLHQTALKNNVLVLNEIGLDPGIDHMLAMVGIDHLRKLGAEIEELEAICGAIPSPESDTNPWHYKFSWSPRGVLQAAKRPAKFKEKGKIYSLPTGQIFGMVRNNEYYEGRPLEVYPNHDALRYVRIFGVNGLKTVYRGTIRWPGWSETMSALYKLGLLDEEDYDFSGTTHRDLILRKVSSQTGSPKSRIADFLNIKPNSPVIERLEWVGLFEDKKILEHTHTPLDALLDLMIPKLKYTDRETDLVILKVRTKGRLKNGEVIQVESTLTEKGVVSQESAVSRTVALPAAIATRLIYEKKIRVKGVRIPTHPEIYNQVLEHLGEIFKITTKISRTKS